MSGGLLVPSGGSDFAWTFSNVSGTRPVSTTWGTSVAQGASNVKGSWTQILSGANVSRDVCFVWICISDNGGSGLIRDTLMDIGVDPAGGTSYTVLLPDLLVSYASDIAEGPGINYFFPIRIKAGSTVAARASMNNASVDSFRVMIQIWGSPKRPELTWVGTKCKAYGVTSASSSGTAITSGTTSDGSMTALASAISESPKWWQLGMGVNDSSMTSANIYTADLGYGSVGTFRLIISDQLFSIPNSTERLWTTGTSDGCFAEVASGGDVVARLQCSGTADSNLSLAAYGVY